MTMMDRVRKIESDIAALPVEYRDLFQKELAWSEAHRWLYAAALMIIGACLSQAVVAVL